MTPGERVLGCRALSGVGFLKDFDRRLKGYGYLSSSRQSRESKTVGTFTSITAAVTPKGDGSSTLENFVHSRISGFETSKQGFSRGGVFSVAVPDGAGPPPLLPVQVPQDTPPQGGEGRFARAGFRGRGNGGPLVRQVDLDSGL